MKPFIKIAGINLGVLLAYSLLVGILFRAGNNYNNERDLSIMILSALLVGLHFLVGIIVTAAQFARNNREAGRAWLASTGLVLLIGFSVCWGNATL